MKLTSDNTASPEVDPFNAPIPGQSLTDEPGNYPWEHPPKHNDPEKLLDVLWDTLTQKEAVEEILVMLDAGVPVEAIVRVLVFTGFAEGEYNPDVGFMIVEPLMEMVTAIGIKAGIKNLKITLKDISNKKFKKTMAQLKVANKETENNNGPMMPAEEALPSPALGGLLSKPQESE
mgnify:CR=1 FL=1|tara:strand:- start:1804 stop:2328 length:525 start_codon:yes stop_codon:yes gene_type:complete